MELAIGLPRRRRQRQIDKQITQIGRPGGIPEVGPHAENILHGAQGGAVRVMDAIGVPAPFGVRREHNHANGTVADVVRALIPSNENRAIVIVRLGGEQLWDFAREPSIAQNPGAGDRGGVGVQLVHVVGEVRRDEVVARDGVVQQIPRQFPVRTNMIGAVGDVGGDVVKINERIVPDRVGIGVGQRRVGPGDVFLISLPRDAGVVEQGDEVVGGLEMIDARRVVIEDTEAGTRLQPEIIRFAGMEAGRIVILSGVRGFWEEMGVNVGAVRAALNG